MPPPPPSPDPIPLSRDCGRLSLAVLALFTTSLVACLRGDDEDGASAPSAGGEAAFSVARPESIDDLVRRAEAIVVARVDAVVDSGERSIVDATPSPGAPPHPTVPYTDYALRIERVVAGGVAAGDGLVLRVGARPGDKAMFDGLRVPRVGDRRLFVLEHPPGADYRVLALAGGIYRVDRDPVILDEVDDTSVGTFTAATSPAAFEDALHQAMQERTGR